MEYTTLKNNLNAIGSLNLKNGSNDQKKSAILLMGPTASGKTRLAIALTKILPIEIINVDSAQVYIGMDIGTNKPNKLELAAAKHYLIDICSPNQPYSVAQFCQDVTKLLPEIYAKGKIPLLVGGTMLYFYALCYGLSDLPSSDPIIRNYLDSQANKYGWKYLHSKLTKIDPVAAAKIMVNDSQRIQRALEVFMTTGNTFSNYLTESTTFLHGIDLHYFAILHQDRKVLHQKIADRFYVMLQQGLLDEVAYLLEQNFDLNLPAMRCVGYRQLIEYLQYNVPEQLAYQNAIIATRQLAKRQYTWLRKWQKLVNLNILYSDSLESDNLKLIQDKIKC